MHWRYCLPSFFASLIDTDADNFRQAGRRTSSPSKEIKDDAITVPPSVGDVSLHGRFAHARSGIAQWINGLLFLLKKLGQSRLFAELSVSTRPVCCAIATARSRAMRGPKNIANPF